ncbi:protein FAR1-RELATED SEQUENCE 5-like [Magnolia sinica]|uniref:protein FAR1-RELATED SEQUENCE 5-like n=1 Tax=Magnolia sinica TaxID=86752 RepID=UPI002659F60A|nr:protein FAR1-RELATED SEQUENCE 5-like [Magnolia sinica]
MESQPNAGVENHNGHQTNHNEHQTNHNEETISHPYDFIPEAPKEVKPIVGMVFISENVAYDFYNEYARWCGFSIRKGSTRNSMKTGETIMRSFICSKEGYRHRKHIEATDHKKRPRAMTRCDCKAKIVVHKNGSDRWEVKTFVEAHSHNLMSPSKVHYLRSHRHFTDSHKVVMDNMRKAGIGAAKVLNFFTNEAGGPEKMGFIDEDARNALKIQRRDKHGKSAQELLLYFQNKQRNDDNFTYAIQINNECRLTSCFWADNISKIDYEAFGDVVCFDTTYKTNQFDMPFGPFVRVNHHKQSILFGAGLLFGETIEDFEWLFQSWLQAMGGKLPKAIITDQDPAIAAAIASVFPNTEHRLCMWHIVQKLPEKLGKVINENPSFNTDWRNCVYMCDQEAEFDALWSKMIVDYNLEENKWLQDLYTIRKMWIPAYVKKTFYAGMSTTQRSEGTRTPEIMEPVLSALEDLVANVRKKCGVEEETSIDKNVEGGESNLLFNAHSKNSYIVLDLMVVNTKGRTSKRFKSGREENNCRKLYLQSLGLPANTEHDHGTSSHSLEEACLVELSDEEDNTLMANYDSVQSCSSSNMKNNNLVPKEVLEVLVNGSLALPHSK